jgi:hypothetical protein
VLLSFYYFRLNHPDPSVVQKLEGRTLDQFCQEEVELWTTHLEKALQRYGEAPESICWVCYEKLHQSPQVTLSKVVDFLQLDGGSIDIAKAVEHHSYANRVKSVKEAAQQGELSFNLRSGSVGKSKQALSPEVQTYIQEKTQEVYAKAYNLA